MDLWQACKDGDFDLVTELVDNGADYNQDYIGEYPLLTAIKNGHTDIVEYLLDLEGIDLSVSDTDGNSILHLATEIDDYDMVAKAIEETDVNALNNYSESALTLALRDGYEDIAKLLVDYGAKITRNDLMSVVELSDGQFLLDSYGEISDDELFRLLSLAVDYSPESFDMLVEYAPERVKELISTDNEAQLLNIVIQSNNTDSIIHLIQLGANINGVDQLGNTPLHNAVIQDASLDTIKTLLEYKADKSIINNEDQKAEQIAKSLGHKTVANFIKSFKLPSALKSASAHKK